MRFALQDCIGRADASHSSQRQQQAEFKGTAQQARELVATLQQSADSLKEMVRYEVQRARQASDEKAHRETEELRRRLALIEEKLERNGTSATEGGETGEKRKRDAEESEAQAGAKDVAVA